MIFFNFQIIIPPEIIHLFPVASYIKYRHVFKRPKNAFYVPYGTETGMCNYNQEYSLDAWWKTYDCDFTNVKYNVSSFTIIIYFLCFKNQS